MKLDFKKNLGDTDRVIRTGVALLLAGYLPVVSGFGPIWRSSWLCSSLWRQHWATELSMICWVGQPLKQKHNLKKTQ